MAVKNKKATKQIPVGGKDNEKVTTSTPKREPKRRIEKTLSPEWVQAKVVSYKSKDKIEQSDSSLEQPKKRKSNKSSANETSSRSLDDTRANGFDEVEGKPPRRKAKGKDTDGPHFEGDDPVEPQNKKVDQKMSITCTDPGDVSSKESSANFSKRKGEKQTMTMKSGSNIVTELESKSLLGEKMMKDEKRKATNTSGPASAAGDFSSKNSLPSDSPASTKGKITGSKTSSFVTSKLSSMDGWTVISPVAVITKQKIRKKSLISNDLSALGRVETRKSAHASSEDDVRSTSEKLKDLRDDNLARSPLTERLLPPGKKLDSQARNMKASLTMTEQKKRLEGVKIAQPDASEKQLIKAREKQFLPTPDIAGATDLKYPRNKSDVAPSTKLTAAPLNSGSLQDNSVKTSDEQRPPTLSHSKCAVDSLETPLDDESMEQNPAKSSQSRASCEKKLQKKSASSQKTRQTESQGADVTGKGQSELEETKQSLSQTQSKSTTASSETFLEDILEKAQKIAPSLPSTKTRDNAARTPKLSFVASDQRNPTRDASEDCAVDHPLNIGRPKAEAESTKKNSQNLQISLEYGSSTEDRPDKEMNFSTKNQYPVPSRKQQINAQKEQPSSTPDFLDVPDHERPPAINHSKPVLELTESSLEGCSLQENQEKSIECRPSTEKRPDKEIKVTKEKQKIESANQLKTAQNKMEKSSSASEDECRVDEDKNASKSLGESIETKPNFKAPQNKMNARLISLAKTGGESDEKVGKLEVHGFNAAYDELDEEVSSIVQRRIDSRKAKRATVAEEVETLLSRLEGRDKAKEKAKINDTVDESKGSATKVGLVSTDRQLEMKVESIRAKTRGGRREKPEDKMSEGDPESSGLQSNLESSGASGDTFRSKQRIFGQGSDVSDGTKSFGSSRPNTLNPKSRMSLSKTSITPTNSPRTSGTGKPETVTPRKSDFLSGPSPALKQKLAIFSSGTSVVPSPSLFGLSKLSSKGPKDKSSLTERTSTIENKLASLDLPFSGSSDNGHTLPDDSPVRTQNEGESMFATSKNRLIEALLSPGRKQKETLAEITTTPRTLKRGFVDLNLKTAKTTTKTPGQRVMDTSHHGREKAQTYVESALDMLSNKTNSAKVERLVSRIESLGGFPKTRRLSMRDNELVGTFVMAVRNDPRITKVHVDAGMFGSISSTLLSQFIDSLRVNLHVKSLSFRGLELGNDFLYDLAGSMESNFVVEEIDLSTNLFTNEGLANFCQALALNNDSVQRLNLKNQTTLISEASQDDVLEAFQQNKTLNKVKLDFVSEDGRQKLDKILERNRLMGSKEPRNVDEKLINVLTDEVERAQELWEQQQEELSIAEVEENDYDYMYQLAVLFDKHKLKKEVEENVKELTGPPKRMNADDLSSDEKKRFLFGDFKKNMEESVMAFKEDGSFFTPEFISKYFKEKPEEDALDFDFHGQWKLFKRFPIHDPARQTIVDKFVEALVTHPRANELTGINMANTGTGDDFIQALSKRCLEDTSLLPNLHTLNFETNFINEPGVVALANMIASPDACKYMQVIRLENQKGLLKSKAEFALAKAMRVNRSIVVISLTIRNLLERERVGKYIMRNVDLLRQARQEHMKATGTQRNRNKVEQVFDRVRENDADLDKVNMMGNERFLTLTKEEKIKAARSFAHNTCVKEIHLNGCGIDDAFAKALGESFSTNTTLEKVYLEGNCISGEGIKALFLGLGKNSSIKELRLHKQTKVLATADEESLADFLDENNTVTKIGMDLRSKVAQVKLDRKMGYNINLELKDKAATK